MFGRKPMVRPKLKSIPFMKNLGQKFLKLDSWLWILLGPLC